MSPRARITLAAGLLILAAVAAYANSLTGELVLDDAPSILENASIRRLWPIGVPLSPPAQEGITVSGRPVLNLSLALNWALGGREVAGYHVVNLAIHILAGLVLFGIVRRTLSPVGRTVGPPADPRSALQAPLVVAFAVALLWLLHPLQTESVTYIIQRAESLMGLFYLLTIYCFIRSVGPTVDRPGVVGPIVDRPGVVGPIVDRPADQRSALQAPAHSAWAWLSILACLLGMGTKEVMVSAPVMVFLYDRAFVAGSLREAWRRRRAYYLGLAATWILLAFLVVRTGNRGGTSGLGIGVGFFQYWLTQFPAVVSYLKLSLWPHPLIFDYGTQWVERPWTVWPQAIVVAALVAGTAWLLIRNRPAGFLGAFFFAILAPTSLVPGGRQTMAEHRMYLALAPVVVLVVWGLWTAFMRWRGTARLRQGFGGHVGGAVFAVVVAALAGGLGWATAERNRDYRTRLELYGDTVAKLPDNAFAQSNLGVALVANRQVDEAIAHYREAIRLNPKSPEACNDLGVVLAGLGRVDEAVAQYEEAIKLRPNYAEVYSNLGQLLFRMGHPADAADFLRHALQLKPAQAEAHLNYGNVLAATGHREEAQSEYREALRLNPFYAEAESNWGNVLFQTGRLSEALPHVQAALRLRPEFAEAHLNLANIIASRGQLADSIAEYQIALRLDPSSAAAHYDLAQVLRALGRSKEAEAEWAKSEQLKGRAGAANR